MPAIFEPGKPGKFPKKILLRVFRIFRVSTYHLCGEAHVSIFCPTIFLSKVPQPRSRKLLRLPYGSLYKGGSKFLRKTRSVFSATLVWTNKINGFTT